MFLAVVELHTCDEFSARLEELLVSIEISKGFAFSSLPKLTNITSYCQ